MQTTAVRKALAGRRFLPERILRQAGNLPIDLIKKVFTNRDMQVNLGLYMRGYDGFSQREMQQISRQIIAAVQMRNEL
jgi:hypothetical protein